MERAWPKPGAKWILPIVLVACAMMVLPAGAVLSHVTQGASSGTSSGSGSHAGVTSEANPSASSDLLSSPLGSTSPLAPTVGSSELQNELRSAPNLAAQSEAADSWVSALLGNSGPGSPQPLASYPNLYYLVHPNTGSAAEAYPGYVGQPAPMGISDLGLGATPYTYYTPHFLGQLTFNSPPNVTQPGAERVISPGVQNLGYLGSYYEFGIQLNTMLTNVSLPGTADGVLWTQNVLNVNSTSIHWVDDVFNFSAGSDGLFGISPYTGVPSILSGCGLTDLSDMLRVSGGVYQCVGRSISISATNYPLTISLYNNVSVNLQDNDVLTFGYVISGAGGLSLSGVSDTLVFNNDGYYDPATPPDFTVSGTGTTPTYGLPLDAELDLVGGVGGDNAVFRSLNGSLDLEYSNDSTGGWQSVPSAYDFGADTGETSIGIAGYWTGHTEYVNQGPSFLYGLWNAIPYASVGPGDIHFSGTITPSYGFVFVSNHAANAFGTNFTWLPTNANGGFNTYLPPAVPPATQYYVQAFADEYAEFNGTPFSSTTTGYVIDLSTSAHTLNAPLYMWGNAQAAELGAAVTGASAPPYTFKDLVVNLNFTFNHLNDYGFPSFEIFSEESVSDAVVVNDLTQGVTGSGTNAPTGNFYLWDLVNTGVTGFLVPGPTLLGPMAGYTSQIQVLESTAASVTDQISYEVAYYVPIVDHTIYNTAGTTMLWQDSGVIVTDLTATDGTYGGVFVGDSIKTVVSNTLATYDAIGVDDFGSMGTSVTNLSAMYYAAGIYALGAFDGTYSWINASYGGLGIFAGGYDYGLGYYKLIGMADAKVTQLNASLDGLGFELLYSTDNTLTAISSYYYGVAGFIAFSNGTSVTNYDVNYEADGVYVEDAQNSATTLTTGVVTNESTGALVEYSSGVTINGLSAMYGSSDRISVGVVISEATGITVEGVSASQWAVGIAAIDSSGLSVTGTQASDQATGVELEFTSSTSVTNSTVSDLAVGAWVYDTTQTVINGVKATNTTLTPLYAAYAMDLFGAPFAAVISEYNSALAVAGITATNYGAAFYDYESSGAVVSASNATSDQYAVVFNATTNSLITGLSAYQDWQGVVIQGDEDYAELNTVTASTFTDDTSYGVVLGYEAEGNLVWNNDFTGNNGATSTYSALHIQAYAYDPDNEYYYCANYDTCLTGVGNFWADWHTYGSNGYLAPYVITGGVIDEFPQGPQESITVTFTETGLSSGTNWSVTFNGVTHSSTTATITFTSTVGTYSYAVNGVQGYQLVSGPTGSVTLVGGAPATISVVYTSTSPLATQSTVNSFFSVALIIAIIALVLALLALLWRRGGEKKPEPTTGAPTPWTPPSGAATGPTSGEATGGAGAGPSSGSGATWSEGSSSGPGSPPPSS